MGNLIQKFNQLTSSRAMQSAYASWVWAKLTTWKPPTLKLGNNVRIGGWIKFSEYWCFQNAVPEAERLFTSRSLGAKPSQAVAFDIGANIGVFTCLLASMGAGQVHSFEPIPETFCRLKNNVIANGLLNRSVLNCLAIGTQPELITFRVHDDSPAENQLAIAQGESAPNPAVSLQHVAATSLDAYCETFGVERIDLLKVDVEGMEPQVLQGGGRMLSQKRILAVLLEVCPKNLTDVGSSPSALYKRITNSGYHPFRLDPSGTPGKPITLGDMERVSLENIVLLPG